MRMVFVLFLVCAFSVVVLGQNEKTETGVQSSEYGAWDKATSYKLVATPYGERLVETDSLYYLYFPSNWNAVTLTLINDGNSPKGKRHIISANDENTRLHTYLLSWEIIENGKVVKNSMLYSLLGSRFGHRKVVWFKYPVAVFPHHKKKTEEDWRGKNTIIK